MGVNVFDFFFLSRVRSCVSKMQIEKKTLSLPGNKRNFQFKLNSRYICVAIRILQIPPSVHSSPEGIDPQVAQYRGHSCQAEPSLQNCLLAICMRASRESARARYCSINYEPPVGSCWSIENCVAHANSNSPAGSIYQLRFACEFRHCGALNELDAECAHRVIISPREPCDVEHYSTRSFRHSRPRAAAAVIKNHNVQHKRAAAAL
jgi:hypothetical protein